MSIKAAMVTNDACRIGSTTVRIHAMYDSEGGDPAIALEFGMGTLTGLTAGFHGSADEAREFARQLILHADSADKASAESQGHNDRMQAEYQGATDGR